MFNRSKSPVADNLPPLPEPPAAQPSSLDALSAPAPAAPVRPAAPARGLSTLAQDMTFTGDLKGAGDVQIEGTLKGEIRVGRVIVGEAGSVEGNVAADYIEVRGRVVGAVTGKQVKLVSTAYLEGDITAEQLSIDVGAYFQGRVAQGRREAPAAARPQAAAPVAAQPAAAPAPAPAPAPVQAPVAPVAPAGDPGLGIPPAPSNATGLD